MTLDELRERFDNGRPYAVGLEDEVMVLDPDTLELSYRATEALEPLRDDGRFKLELPACQLEIVTPPSETVIEAAAVLLDGRRALVQSAGGALRFAAAGVHPSSPGSGELNRSARYEPIAAEYGAIAARQLVCALQVHVSAGGADRALAVYNAARSYLPLLAALGANAPFYEGVDTGLASVRPKIAQLLPRQGIPPAIAAWQEYHDLLIWGSASGAFPEPGRWWWELRLHPGFGTLEFRVPDAQSSVGDAAAVAAVVQTLVAWLGARHDAGEPLPVHPTWRIDENRWAACRDGVEGEMADLDTGRRRPTRAWLNELFEVLTPIASACRCGRELERARALCACNGALAQREAARPAGVAGAVRWLSERFLEFPAG